ncbi:D-alanine--D-alanine ligase A [Candidatus Falkowbacteria bacterium CG10_big_fil_rev_8_21_14_0_10_43_10]|uniref:D-alanine--D-alanine ligase n=1 Tax=Candidatus Falkowbacteria bacterium CG10_big_fil_rev_8_21_14_0_10_43_10 TaxID=1974567 RepID=A0A2H0V3W9_9BACT|nr:MAG: D-alanine--D-alanine ligase A [Candidatus Falkowbacteria bacterium CG10_big_fil_rev_8_21_14_0_10_43_10]
MSKKRICLLFGGKSGEHEVSLQSAKSIYEALDKEKYEVLLVGIDKQGKWRLGNSANYLLNADSGDYTQTKLNTEAMQAIVPVSDNNTTSLISQSNGREMGKVDIVLPAVHGPYGEDGKLQGMLDMLGVPYVFSGTLASALAMNKAKTKLIAKSIGLTVAEDIVLEKDNEYNINNIINKLSLPIVVKPNELGSSVGTTIVNSAQELKAGIKEGFKYDHTLILEQFIKGRELTVPIMGNNSPKALPVIEIIPKVSGWFDYRAKYAVGGSDEICPADIPGDIKSKIQEMSVKIFKAVGCADLARADFIWSKENGELYFLEINTIPGLTKNSLTPKAAKVAGMSFSEFLDKLIKLAEKRYNKKL